MPEIKQLDKLTDEELESLIGKRVVLGGRGLLDGLKHMSKSSSYRVIGIFNDEYYGRFIRMKEHGRRITVLLPQPAWNQQVAILTEKEYKKLPKYK